MNTNGKTITLTKIIIIRDNEILMSKYSFQEKEFVVKNTSTLPFLLDVISLQDNIPFNKKNDFIQ